jgi:hypothetical protein
VPPCCLNDAALGPAETTQNTPGSAHCSTSDGMASSNATVTALKAAFLQTQVNQFLSKPLEPSDRALRGPADGQALPRRVIQEATQKGRLRALDVWPSCELL